MANVGLLYNLGTHRSVEDDEPPDAGAELDGESTIAAVEDALKWGGHEVILIEANTDSFDILRKSGIDIAFNMAEGVRGESRESQIPAMLEMLGIPYTGSGVLALALSLDKPMAKKMFQHHGIPTPRFKTIGPRDVIEKGELSYPLFVKPAHEGSSMGVQPSSLVNDRAQLVEQVRYVIDTYRQEALVEEFIDGREFTVGLVGNHSPKVFPVMEIEFGHCPPEHKNIYSRRYKTEWSDNAYYPCPAHISLAEEVLLKATALDAFRALGCRDVCRVDFRAKDGVAYVLEVNPLPGLAPGFSDLPREAEAAGVSYNELINLIVQAALERCSSFFAETNRVNTKIAD